MTCPSAGSLRTFSDGELSAPESKHIEQHLQSCAPCRAQLEALHHQSNGVRDAMGALAPEQEHAADAVSAYAAFRTAAVESEPPPSRGSFAAWRTSAWGAAAACLLIVLFSFAPARSWAQRFLSMLRVQKLAVVPVDLSAVTAEVGANQGKKLITQLISDNVTVTLKPGRPVSASSPQVAGQMAGFSVQTLDGLGVPKDILVSDEAAFYLTLDRQRIEAVLNQINRPDIQVPSNIDGSIIAVHIPKAVHMAYANMDFTQVPSPTVSVPPSLNISALAEAALQVAGMSPAEAHAFCQSVDWTSTLVIPVPEAASSYQSVRVEGTDGTLIQAPARGKFPGGYALIWTKNGIIYSISGKGPADPAVAVAESLH